MLLSPSRLTNQCTSTVVSHSIFHWRQLLATVCSRQNERKFSFYLCNSLMSAPSPLNDTIATRVVISSDLSLSQTSAPIHLLSPKNFVVSDIHSILTRLLHSTSTLVQHSLPRISVTVMLYSRGRPRPPLTVSTWAVYYRHISTM